MEHSENNITKETFHIDLGGGLQSAVHRYNGGGDPVLMIHGSIEDSKIFHSRSGKGFAPFLAKAGFDVFAPDLAGKGASRPKITKGFDHSQRDFLERDLNLYVDAIRRIHPDAPLRTVAHSWGGVLLLAWMARFAKDISLGPAVFFASKRRIGVISLRRLLMVDAVWTIAGIAATAVKGYLPAKAMKMGSDNEPAAFYKQVNRWVYSKKWKDASDGFDYAAALKDTALPPVLYFAGKADKVLGYPKDVRTLMEETGAGNAKFVLLGIKEGHQKDYGHIDLLTSKTCPDDHFSMAVEWLRGETITGPDDY